MYANGRYHSDIWFMCKSEEHKPVTVDVGHSMGKDEAFAINNTHFYSRECCIDTGEKVIDFCNKKRTQSFFSSVQSSM